jgi:hypothetical protein
MKHFSLENWADFARQVIGEQERAEMQSHLDKDGCRKCSKVLSMWQRVHVVARREHAYQPPDSAVCSMKGTFAIKGRTRATHGIGLVAELLFDSVQNPLAAGARSTGVVPRQLLYAVGDYRVDVRIEPQADSDKANLVGQVLNAVEPNRVDAVRVALLSDRKPVSESVTNRLGEFQLASDAAGRFHLKVYLPGREVTLPAIEATPKEIEDLTESTDSTSVNTRSKRRRKGTRKKV